MEITLTKEEQKAIESLKRLAKKWPSTLGLFSWSGSLCVTKNPSGGSPVEDTEACVVDSVSGIINGGGDPELNSNPDITYE